MKEQFRGFGEGVHVLPSPVCAGGTPVLNQRRIHCWLLSEALSMGLWSSFGCWKLWKICLRCSAWLNLSDSCSLSAFTWQKSPWHWGTCIKKESSTGIWSQRISCWITKVQLWAWVRLPGLWKQFSQRSHTSALGESPQNSGRVGALLG